MIEKIISRRTKVCCPLLITFLLIHSSICHPQPKSPLEVVKLFDRAYGSPLMDEVADHAKFRDNKPKSVWVVKAHARGHEFHKHPQSYVIERLKSHDIVFLGTTHKREAILKFVADLIPRLYEEGITHLGLEICSDQQGKIDSFIQTGNGLREIELHPQIDCTEYRNLFTTLRSLDQINRPAAVALDLPKSMYQREINRDQWMACSIVKIFHQNPNAKVLVVAGDLHILKKIEWEDHVQNPHGFIRSYLNELIPNYQMFSIGQCIDESPNECDFTREFSHLEGAVAMDCNGKFNGWKIGFMAPVAAEQTEVCELLDGIIVY